MQCNEPICAMDFPGGIKALLRYKQVKGLLESGMDVNQLAEALGIHITNARKLFKKMQATN